MVPFFLFFFFGARLTVDGIFECILVVRFLRWIFFFKGKNSCLLSYLVDQFIAETKQGFTEPEVNGLEKMLSFPGEGLLNRRLVYYRHSKNVHAAVVLDVACGQNCEHHSSPNSYPTPTPNCLALRGLNQAPVLSKITNLLRRSAAWQ